MRRTTLQHATTQQAFGKLLAQQCRTMCGVGESRGADVGESRGADVVRSAHFCSSAELDTSAGALCTLGVQ